MQRNIFRNKAINLTARLAITGLLMWYVLGRNDLSGVLTRISGFSVAWLFMAFSVLLSLVPIATVRWQRIIQIIHGSIGFMNAFRLELIGLFFNQSLPSAVGGDALRIWLLFKQGVPATKAANSVVLDRISALVATIVLMGFCLPEMSRLVSDRVMLATLRATVAILLAGTLLLPRLNILIGLLPSWGPLRFLSVAAEDAHKLFGKNRPSLETFSFSLLIQLLTGVTVFLIARSLGVAVGVIPCVVMMPPVLILSMLPISIAGWGVRELAMIKGALPIC
jgi:uncharacterized membrane protein YbhN (UPF0104 family)